ncbi:MAG: hypothetical protein AAF558_07355 [Verrucomicrobiota bacterium]
MSYCCFAWLFLLASCGKHNEISDFKSDGCSLFPDHSLISNDDWSECCYLHDVAYWKGGTDEERLSADQALRDCIIEKTGNIELADLMYQGVRFGGSPYFYNWYRWGYGWGYDRKYQPLSDKEKLQVKAKLEKYYSENPKSACSCSK